MILRRYACYPLALGLAGVVIAAAGEEARLLAAASRMQSLAGASELAWKSLLETLSLSFYSGAADVREAYAGLLAEAARAHQRGTGAAIALCAAGTAQLVMLRTAWRASQLEFARHQALLGAIAFAVGITAPMLTLEAHAEIPVLGVVILSHESRSVVSAVAGLAAQQALGLALLLGAFSVAVPLVKFALTAIALLPGPPARRASSIALMQHLGRWSMVDVFVVAMFVAMMAAGRAHGTAARAGLGLTFFAVYGVLSLSSTHRVAGAAVVAPGEE